MMKVWFTASRNLRNASKATSNNLQHQVFNTLRVVSFSYVNHNNEHNVGAPPPRSPPKVQISVEDPKDDLYDKKGGRRHRKTEDAGSYVADKAKSGTKGVVETAFNMGAAVAEGMEKSWGGIKETTEKLKDSVLGDDDENNEKRYGDDMRGSDQGYVDKNIDDLRKKAGEYDQRRH